MKKMSKMDADHWLQIGLAVIDIYTGKTHLYETKENFVPSSLATCMDNVERYISIYNPSECIFIGTEVEEGLLRELANYANIQSKCMLHLYAFDNNGDGDSYEKIRKCEKQTYQREVLQTFYAVENFDAFYESFLPHTLATQSFCYLLDFVFQHNPSLVKKIDEPIFEHNADRLLLANHSLKQLNILDDTHATDYKGRYSSVETFLNQCATPMGRRRFSHLLLNPITNPDILNRRYEIMEHTLSNFANLENWLPNRLQSFKDNGKIFRLIVSKRVTPKQLVFLYQNVKTTLDIATRLKEENPILHDYCVSNQKTQKRNVSIACQTIQSFFDMHLTIEVCSSIDVTTNFDAHIFLKKVDTPLDNLITSWTQSMDQLNAIASFLSQEMLHIESSSSTSKKKKAEHSIGTTDYVKLYETEKGFLSLIATKKRTELLKKSTQKKVSIPIHGSSTSTYEFDLSAVTFSAQNGSNNAIQSPQIDALCQTCQQRKQEINERMNTVYMHTFLPSLEAYQEDIDCIFSYITELDVLYTKCAVAKKYHYCRPTLGSSQEKDPGSFFEATGVRHLLIEQIQKDEAYVVNDLALYSNKREKTEKTEKTDNKEETLNGVLLYGTNAVGKTSFIRSIGICIVLAQAGMFVPCKSFIYKPYKAIYTRILGNDNLFKGLSSFAVEMMELRTLLKHADAYSLVLGDELCSGTESISAKSIFVAGVESLHSKHASFIFATHLHEIVDYEELKDMKGVKCMHMAVTYDRSLDRLVYNRKLVDGAGSNMYGLEVCKSLHMPADFLTRANELRMKYNPEYGSLLNIKQSHYNAQKLMGLCELCNHKRGQEVHHIAEQSRAEEDGYIVEDDGTVFHKNRRFNLLSLCADCHKEIHRK
jgi:DNA mismatch repair protein MutS